MKLIIALIIISLIVLFILSNVFAVQTVQLVPKPIEKFQYDDDKTLNNKEYFGWASVNSATSSAVWKIMRMTYTGNDFVIEWCDGDSLYNNVWDNRASLDYE